MSTPLLSELPPGFHRFRCVIEDTLGFEVFVWRGEQAGSTLLLNGGTHGDEYEGPVFLNELARDWRPAELNGTLVVIPILHEAAFFAGRRDSPLDGKNLARVFPGNENGSETEKIAFAFETQFLAHANFYADFHSAGAAYEILPWAGYMMSEDARTLETQRKMARCFPDVWHWGTAYLPGRTLSVAHERNIPAIYLEFYGAGTVAQKDLRRLNIGFQNLLRVCGLTDGATDLNTPFAVRESTRQEEGHLQIEHPAPCDGILMEITRLGARVQAGDVLASVQPLDGSAPQTIVAERSGRLVFRRRQRSIEKGEVLGTIVEI